MIRLFLGIIFVCSGIFTTADKAQPSAFFFKNFTLIDGTGGPGLAGANMLVQGDTIAGINLQLVPRGSRIIDLAGKTIIPSLINAHGHLGILKGTTTSFENYTQENIQRQLLKYQRYGVEAVLSLGTDYDLIFALRDASKRGKLPGAQIFTAGFGFGVPGGLPALNFTSTRVYRPSNPQEAVSFVDELAPLRPDVIKIWVDDFYGQYPVMQREIYTAIIQEAHKNSLRVAAHVFHLQDARRLVDANVDILAHSIRDGDIDDTLLDEMRAKGVVYVPTLCLDEYQFIYTDDPSWATDPFFQASLEPGVYDMLTSDDYLKKLKANPQFSKMEQYFQTAMRNAFRVYRHGIKMALGTDSGANPVRTQGFSEHLELELMTKAGIPVIQAISIATLGGASLLRMEPKAGTLQVGKKASFLILDADPQVDIKNTRKIAGVWQDGVEVSHGPIK